MSESVESYLARGGRVQAIPTGQGKKEAANKQPKGFKLRERLTAEANQHKALVAQKSGGRK